MKPTSPEPADLIALLRQQVLLAQVRIMELEDQRDELAPRLADQDALLAAAQRVAEIKVEEAAHLEKVRADLQAGHDHLRHLQHVAHEALQAARAENAAMTGRQLELLDEIEHLQLLARQLADTEREHRQLLAGLRAERDSLQKESAARHARIAELDAEQRALKASRSWRWTSWLRSLERAFK